MSRRVSDPEDADEPPLNEAAEEAVEEGADSGTLRVVVRLRPFHTGEIGADMAPAIRCAPDGQTLELAGAKPGEPTRCFTFNAMLGPDATQADVYERSGVRPLLTRALNGYACTVFAFGQTGSGKTHTITGHSVSPDGLPSRGDAEGLMPRALRELAGAAAQLRRRGKVTLSASYIEVYNEQVLDLLNPHSGRGALPVRWKASHGFYVENLFVVECTGEDDLLAVMEEGTRYRHIAAHDMNERSSRSHAILTVSIDRDAAADADNDDDDELAQGLAKRLHGSIAFVDLAGSERVKVTKSLLVESNNINQSLLTLGNCISALGDPKKRNGHIPYRDSALTMLLKDSLGGTGLTLMIACVSPATPSLQETHNTLRYANRAKRIRNKPVVHMDPQQQLILALKREVHALRTEVGYLRGQAGPGASGRQPLPPAFQAAIGGHSASTKGAASDAASETVEADMRAFALELMQTRLMLHQYMEDNDTLRTENVQLYGQNDAMQRQYEDAINENAHLVRLADAVGAPGRSVLRGGVSGYHAGQRSWAHTSKTLRGQAFPSHAGAPNASSAHTMHETQSSVDDRRLQFDKSDTTLFREIASGAFEDQLVRHLDEEEDSLDVGSARSSAAGGVFSASSSLAHSHSGGGLLRRGPNAPQSTGSLPPLSPGRRQHDGGSGGGGGGGRGGRSPRAVNAASLHSGGAQGALAGAVSTSTRPVALRGYGQSTVSHGPRVAAAPTAAVVTASYSSVAPLAATQVSTRAPTQPLLTATKTPPAARASPTKAKGASPAAMALPTASHSGRESLGSVNQALRRELDELEVELMEAEREVSDTTRKDAGNAPTGNVPAGNARRKKKRLAGSSKQDLVDWTIPGL